MTPTFALWRQAQNGTLTPETCVNLVYKGAQLDGVDANQYGRTALHWAAFNGHAHVVKVLIDAKASVNAPNAYSNTALHLSSRANQKDIVKVLLEAGAHTELKNINEKTAMHFAAWSGDVQLISSLCEAKASINAKDSRMWTPLHFACTRGKAAAVELLLQAGCSPAEMNSENATPLSLCVSNMQVPCLQILIENSSPDDRKILEDLWFAHVLSAPNTANRRRCAALKAAGRLCVSEAMLQANVPVHTIDKHGTSLLMAVQAVSDPNSGCRVCREAILTHCGIIIPESTELNPMELIYARLNSGSSSSGSDRERSQ
jgi:ankyrin repeat protein